MNIVKIFQNYIAKLGNNYANYKLRKDYINQKIRISNDADIQFANIKFEGRNIIANKTKISGNLKLGYASSIGINCNLNGDIIIGKFCQIGGYVAMYSTNHPIDYLSIYTGNNLFNGLLKSNTQFGKIEIGNDVWIGHGVVILKDIKIGNGAILGSGSIITKDVPPYAIVVGSPAKIIKYRFSDEIIAKLNEIKWWDKSIEELESKKDYFTYPIKSIEDIKDFL
jgi:acetyltransferase-like isoleucine patch superfamily enzyme